MLPVPRSAHDEQLVLSLVRMDAGRRLAAGLSTIIMWHTRSYQAMGWCMLITGGLVAGVDGWAARAVGIKGAGWEHWVFVPVAVSMGLALLKYV